MRNALSVPPKMCAFAKYESSVWLIVETPVEKKFIVSCERGGKIRTTSGVHWSGGRGGRLGAGAGAEARSKRQTEDETALRTLILSLKKTLRHSSRRSGPTYWL
jgi:hypothetical protein